MKIVAVSQRVDIFRGHLERRDALDQRVTRFLFAAGFIAVPVPNIFQSVSHNDVLEPHLDFFLGKIKPDALFLSGGNDIGQSCERDETELALLRYAEQNKLPLLGICRGMQMMAYRAGASLVPSFGHTRTRHEIKGEICGTVNSYHNFSVSGCPVSFRVIARSNDNCIEAIRHHNLPWEGWMWHPEREVNFAKRDIERLRSLFKA